MTWICQTCTYININDRAVRCHACDVHRPNGAAAAPAIVDLLEICSPKVTATATDDDQSQAARRRRGDIMESNRSRRRRRLEQSTSISEGGNDFSGCSRTIFEGTYDTTCVQNSCQFELNAIHNHWGYGSNSLSNAQGLVFPPPSLIRVNASGTPVCSGYESGNTCNLNLIDREPILPVACLPRGKRSLTYTHPNIDTWLEILNGVITKSIV